MPIRRAVALPLLAALAALVTLPAAGCGDAAPPTAAVARAIPIAGPRAHYAPAGFAIAPDPGDFGSVSIGDTRTLTFTISKTGDPFTITELALDYAGSGVIPAAIPDPASGAPPCAQVYSASTPVSACRLAYSFTAFEVGLKVARARLRSVDAQGNPNQDVWVDMVGTGVTYQVSPAQVAFGEQVVGSTSGAQTVTITNPGSAALTFQGAIGITGSNAADFATAAGTTCGTAPVAPGGSCVIALAFAPTAVGSRSATLGASTSQGTLSVPLTGTGVQVADVAVSLGGSDAQGLAGKPFTYTITVRNAGSAAATGVQLSDVIPQTTTFAALAAPGGVACVPPAVGSSGTLVCNVGSLASGQSVVVTLTVNMLSGGKSSVSNTAVVTSTSPDAVAANNSATLTVTVRGRK